MIKFRRKEETPYIDDEKLIEQVEKHKFLYETKHHDYRNLPLRLNTWNQIAEILNVTDQNFIQKRWKVLREKFSVGYRKEVNEGIRCNWIYYDKLQFLKPFVSLKAPPEVKPRTNIELPMIVTTSPCDELILVRLVREHPVLYDKKHEDFRSGCARERAWEEISKRTKWNVTALQKRWRVLRDRFVRELRRTQKLDANVQMNCSQFFREMLFLARHVRSGKYEVETSFEDDDTCKAGNDTGEIMTEGWVLQESYSGAGDNESYQYVEESIELEPSQQSFDENAEESSSKFDCTEYVESSSDYEPEENDFESEKHLNDKSHSKAESTSERNKRNASEEINQHQPSTKIPRTTLKSPARTVDDMNDKDEDMAFGQTIGCMLKKIPKHLKTAVKLKLLTSLSEFETQHNLV